jgi:hypothetical protein
MDPLVKTIAVTLDDPNQNNTNQFCDQHAQKYSNVCSNIRNWSTCKKTQFIIFLQSYVIAMVKNLLSNLNSLNNTFIVFQKLNR